MSQYQVRLISGLSFSGRGRGSIRKGEVKLVDSTEANYWRKQPEVSVTMVKGPEKPKSESKLDEPHRESPKASKPETPPAPAPLPWDMKSNKDGLMKAAESRGILVGSDDSKAEIVHLLDTFDRGEKLAEDRMVMSDDDEEDDDDDLD